MAYSLTCPHCGAVVKSPFVRVGAVVLCGQCSKRYTVREPDIQRPAPAAPENAPATPADHPAVEADPGKPAEAPGLSGLSNLMKRSEEVQDRVGVGPDETLEEAEPYAPHADLVEESASPATTLSIAVKRRADKQRRRRLIQIFCLTGAMLGIAVAFTILLVLLMNRDDTAMDPPDDGPAPAAALPPEDALPTEPKAPDTFPSDRVAPRDTPPAADDGGPVDLPRPVTPAPTPPARDPLVTIRAMGPTPWQRLDPPMPLPEPDRQPVRVESLRLQQEGGRRIAEVKIVSDTLAVIDDAELRLYQIDNDRRGFFTRQQIPMLEPLSSRTLYLPISDQADAEARFLATVQLNRTADRVTPLERILVAFDAAVSDDQGTPLRLVIQEPVGGRARRIALILTATPANGSPRAWRVDLEGDFGDASSYPLEVIIPEPGLADADWAATGYVLE